MKCVGLIGGSSLLHASTEGSALHGLTRKVVTAPGASPVVVHCGTVQGAAEPTRLVFVQRHQADPTTEYVQPAKIDYASIAAALAQEGCQAVLGVCSVGALHADTALGTLVVPDDFWCPWDLRSAFDDYRSHFVPGTSLPCVSRASAAAVSLLLATHVPDVAPPCTVRRGLTCRVRRQGARADL